MRMKKFTFILAILISTIIASGQDNTALQLKINNMQESYFYLLNRTDKLSKSFISSSQSFDYSSILKNALAVQKLDSALYQVYAAETDSWINDSKDEYSYDSRMNNTVWSEKKWDESSSMWQEESRTEITYNENDQVNVMEMYYADDTWGEMVLESRTEAYYNAEGRLDSILHYGIEAGNPSVVEARQTYQFNEAGQLVQMDLTAVEEDEGEEYVISMVYLYFYNDEGKINIVNINIFEGDVQYPYSDTRYFYDNSGRLSASEEKVVNLSTLLFQNSSRTGYEYNESGDVSVETSFIWDADSGEWAEYEQDEYTYSTTSFSEVKFPNYLQLWGINEPSMTPANAISEINTYSMIEEEWSLSERTQFFYSDETSTGVRDIPRTFVSTYPNPATENVTFTWNGYNQLSLELYTATGVKVLEKQIHSGMEVPVSLLTNGIYIYRLLDKNLALQSGKLIIK